VRRGWAVSMLSLAACALAAVPVTSDAPGAHAPRLAQRDGATIDVTGIWQTIRDLRNPWTLTECIQEGATFSVRHPESNTPWTLSLTQVGTTLSGTLQQSGPDNWCAPDPVPIRDGTVEGDLMSFRVETPSGSTVEFVGVVEPDGHSIALSRSPVAPGAAAPAPNNLGPFDTQGVPYPSLVVERVTSPAGNGCPDGNPVWMARCEAADPQAPPFATGTLRWVATDGIQFSPWTFALTIGLNGVVTGSVGQSAMEPPTRSGPAPTGPFAVVSGQADARRLAVTIKSPDGTRLVRFSGVRHGKDAIDFRRTAIAMHQSTVSQSLSGSNLRDLFGLAAVTEFTARRVSEDQTGAPPDAPSGAPPDNTVTLESVEDRFAVVPPSSPDGTGASSQEAMARPAFVLVRYQVQPTFEGRLFVLALDGTGQPIRQFEVLATPGPHLALWDLRPTGSGPATAADNSATEQDLQVAETRARIVTSALRLATDVPSEAAAAGLATTLSALLAGPGGDGATPAGSRFAAPGTDTVALARLSGGSLTVLATRPCVVTAASGK
jgi:hypothetical protein